MESSSTSALPVGEAPAQPRFELAPVSEGLLAPVELTFAPKEPGIFYVADQTGYVYRFAPFPALFLDIHAYLPALDPHYDERGLLGLAFHPAFTSKEGRFYVFYSAAGSDRFATEGGGGHYRNRLSQFAVREGRVLRDQEVVLMEISGASDIHNGGKIAFGPDGYLYIGVGDGGAGLLHGTTTLRFHF